MRDGIRLHREGWYGPATARFRQAVEVMPGYTRAYLWLGRSGLKAGRDDEARRALYQVIALDPQSDAAQEAQVLLSQITVVGGRP
jgi:Flp pilus assembly protein TadD